RRRSGRIRNDGAWADLSEGGLEQGNESSEVQRGRIHESTGCDGGGGGGSAGPCGNGGSGACGTCTSAAARGTSGIEYACVGGCAFGCCAPGCACAGAWVIAPFSRSRIMMTLSLPLDRSLVTWLALTWILMWCWVLPSSGGA